MDHGRENSAEWANLADSTIIPPVYLHPSAQVRQSTIGPHVSLGEGTVVENSSIKDAIIGSQTTIVNSQLETSLIGDRVMLSGLSGKFNLGDDSQVSG
jgi:glucose-1-phosphate thymidylyltransferase